MAGTPWTAAISSIFSVKPSKSGVSPSAGRYRSVLVQSAGVRVSTTPSVPRYSDTVPEIITSVMVQRMQMLASPTPLRFIR